jgi:uncharacterized membrane protein
MHTIYFLFKFLHVAGASIWIGGLCTMAVLNARLARAADPRTLVAMTRQSQQAGALMMMPAALVTLAAGGVAMAVSGIGFAAWIAWGFIAIALSVALGAGFVRRSVKAMIDRLETVGTRDSQVAALQRRLAVLNVALVAILLSAVWAMVFKPTL